MIKIFIGCERYEYIQAKVLEYSIKSRTKTDVAVYLLFDEMDKKGIKVPIPEDPKNRPRTNFSFHRWCIPELCDHKGKAIYCDSDQLVFGDVADFLQYEETQLKTLVFNKCEGYIETSVMLINCDLVDWNINSIVNQLNQKTLNYNQLMFNLGLMKPEEYALGVDPNWNSLDTYIPKETKLLHYTDRSRQPWGGVRAPHELDFLWFAEFLKAYEANYFDYSRVEKYVAKGWINPKCLELVKKKNQ